MNEITFIINFVILESLAFLESRRQHPLPCSSSTVFSSLNIIRRLRNCFGTDWIIKKYSSWNYVLLVTGYACMYWLALTGYAVLCRILTLFFLSVTGYASLYWLAVTGYAQNAAVIFFKNNIPTNLNLPISRIEQLVTACRVISNEYHFFSFVIQLLSQLSRHMFISHRTEYSQMT